MIARRLLLVLGLALAGCGRGPDADDVAANNRGVGLMGMFRYGDAHDVFSALLEAHPEWTAVRVNLAVATLNRQRQGDEQRALELLAQAIEQEPGNLRAHYCAGVLKYRAADPAALEHLDRVARADPDDAYAAYYHAAALEQADRADEAAAQYRRAVGLDPYLRSAWYRLSRVLLRSESGAAEAEAAMETFQKLQDNPRARAVDYVYTKMGPKSEALAVDVERPAPRPRPAGAVLAEAEPLLAAAGRSWRGGAPVTAGDLDGDGDLDLLLPGGLGEPGLFNAVLLNDGAGGFSVDAGHPLADVTAVNAALLGDFDNDTLTDVYLCRKGPNRLWRQGSAGSWEDVTEATGTGGGTRDTVDGAVFDADHDGDLDVFCVNADGPNELFNNNMDGTFRPIAAEQGIAGGGGPSRAVLVADLDRDRDVDIVVLNASPPQEVYLNDRLWRYTPMSAPELASLDVAAAAVGDLDADGQVELYLRLAGGTVRAWHPSAREVVAVQDPGGTGRLGVLDLDGDGTRELAGLDGWQPVLLDAARGPALVAVQPAGPAIRRPGPGRFTFAALRLTGMEDPGQSMRSNASGIGAHVAVRVDSRWTVFDTYRAGGGPGQSLQPFAVGLGGAAQIDFVSIDWPDGVFQTEIDLAAGELHEIRETQRQVSSCPVLFAFNGRGYEFVSDLLGVGGLGYLLAPGQYSEPRPWENFLLPRKLLRPDNGRYLLRLGEPMEEACYLDAAALVAWDLPPGFSMVLDERMGVSGPAPTGEPRFYRRELLPLRAVNDRGADVLGLVAEADGRAAPVGALDRRFIGRLEEPNVVTLEFAEPLDAGPGASMLVADGWIEYPYSQTMFASWQAGAEYRAPTIEARDTGGTWRVVLEQFGYPAGMPRRMSVPLAGLPAGARALRITTNQEIYWDRLAVAFAEPLPEARRSALPLDAARVARSGFARRTTGPQRLPHYDYGDRQPFWDTRHQAGFYTAFGDALPLLSGRDGAVAVFGPGEEVQLEFDAAAPPLPEGWSRRFVLEARGWCKDMDLFTRDGETVGPLPGERSPEAQALQERYTTRYEAGR